MLPGEVAAPSAGGGGRDAIWDQSDANPQIHPSNIFQSQVGDEEEIASTDREDWRLEVPLQQVSAKPYNGRDSNGYPVE